jgi:hypothetical protein
LERAFGALTSKAIYGCIRKAEAQLLLVHRYIRDAENNASDGETGNEADDDMDESDSSGSDSE